VSLMQQHHSQRNPAKQSDSFAELVREVQSRKQHPPSNTSSTKPSSNPHTSLEPPPDTASPVGVAAVASTPSQPTASTPSQPLSNGSCGRGTRSSSRRADRSEVTPSADDGLGDAAAATVDLTREPGDDDFDEDDDNFPYESPYELVSLSQAQPY
jgi:hypothetical protein